MKTEVSVVFCCLAVASMLRSAFGCHAYHHERRRRSLIVSEVGNDSWGGTPVAETEQLRRFFAECLQRKVPTALRSVGTAVDFTILETNWYLNSDEDRCSNDDSVSCWQTRLSNYLKPDSIFFIPARQCMEEYQAEMATDDAASYRVRRRATSTLYHVAPGRGYIGAVLTTSYYDAEVDRYRRCAENLAPESSEISTFDISALVDFVANHTKCSFDSGDCQYSGIRSKTRDWPYRLEALVKPDSLMHNVVAECNEEIFPVTGWTRWSTWTPCSGACGSMNKQFRHRTCQRGGPGSVVAEECRGLHSDHRPCRPPNCEYHWGAWSACNATCGAASRMRKRVCDRETTECVNPVHIQTEACPAVLCPHWEAWTPWSSCSTSCLRPGTTRYQFRWRGCSELNQCGNEREEKRKCPVLRNCGVHWTTWAFTSPCSSSCNRRRTRACVGPNGAARGCAGVSESVVKCLLPPCSLASPGTGLWSEWESWTSCSYSGCGKTPSHSRRTRICIRDVGMTCEGPSSQARNCQSGCGNWNSWTPCDRTCGAGAGTQIRSRSCDNGAVKKISAIASCHTESLQRRDCRNTAPCS